ncbi:hypothetical protein [Neomicrococcus lactis]|uniref:Uncharacterized protein n=1 Tax=Neomicrococcus lactis TaxID=732241 RepID=A0A7W8YD57_9MICC|nr:hypothetical protein [Neomicrococcus lactis]MBB5599368.1 hypothetical protein [Neomicrococcus lactis]
MERTPMSPVEKAFGAAIKEHEAAQTRPVTPIPDLRIGPPPAQTATPDKGQEDK